MRPILVYFLILALGAIPARAAAPSDPAVTQGLQLYETESNGLEACLQAWFSDKPKLGEDLLQKISPVARDLGVVLGAEVVATQRVSQRVERYFIVIYYARRPLWFALERYSLPDKTTSLDLKFSTDADTIVPAYLTEVQQ
jgi:hypothetical protein